MLRTLWTSRSGMMATQEKLDSISNNVVNSGTTGYKKVEVGFKDLLTETLDRNGVPLNDKSTVIGTGSKTGEWYRDISQGSLLESGVNSNIAIDGEGFFRVIEADGEVSYSRDGSFTVDSMGRIINSEGNLLEVQYENGYSAENINLTTNNMLVDTSGNLFVKNSDTFTKVGEIHLYTAVGDRAFLAKGDNLYYPNEGVEVYRTTNAEIYQGLVEGSNVDIATEFTDMIMTQRAFELSAKGITTADEMWQLVNNMRS